MTAGDAIHARALPQYVADMVRRLPPPRTPVVSSSTPVVAFGDPTRAEVATLGINPSSREFAGVDAALLAGSERRLATMQSIGAEQLDQLNDEQVASVVADCETYFYRRPYRRWFDPLEELLRVGTGTSYYDGSACHLDLVQWATDPIWGRISDADVRRALLEDGVPHLRAQLARENVRLVLLNGRQVCEQVRAGGLTHLVEAGGIPVARGTCRLYTGSGQGIHWVGWSANLQSSWGVSTAFKEELAAWVAGLCVPKAAAEAAETATFPVQLTPDGHLPRGLRVTGKRELVTVLRSWLRHSKAVTVGDVGSFGGRPWLVVEVGGHEVALNADTKRRAVEAFVRDSLSDPDRAWRVIPNRRGQVNKVIPGPDPEPVPGWYAYVTRPLGAAETI
jgi:hypothetical protein